MSVTTPSGFLAAGVAAGIKSNGRKDLALVVNRGPSSAAAAVFTTNRVFAAPVAWSRDAVADGNLQAVVLNSGGANACTGRPGYEDAYATALEAAQLIDCESADVAVCSTGLIGVRLPLDALLAGVRSAHQQLSIQGGAAAAEAIMTTDTHPKQAEYLGQGWSIGGMAKGAGMLAPGLATMLVVLTTDAVISHQVLRTALGRAAAQSFDRIDSDGCMSTNDTVIAMSSGASEMRVDSEQFTQALTKVCCALAQQLIADAEGASHDIAIRVVGAASEADALEVAREIGRSNLVKCAIFGNDPNWGRVLSAIGVTKAAFRVDELDVSINGIQVCRASGVGEDRSLVDLTPRECEILVDLHAGQREATIWTNDLTYGYVKENAEYSS